MGHENYSLLPHLAKTKSLSRKILQRRKKNEVGVHDCKHAQHRGRPRPERTLPLPIELMANTYSMPTYRLISLMHQVDSVC